MIENDPKNPEQPKYPEQPIVPSDLLDVLSWDVKVHGEFLFCITEIIEHFFDFGYVVKWEGSVVRQDGS